MLFIVCVCVCLSVCIDISKSVCVIPKEFSDKNRVFNPAFIQLLDRISVTTAAR